MLKDAKRFGKIGNVNKRFVHILYLDIHDIVAEYLTVKLFRFAMLKNIFKPQFQLC